MSGQWWVVSIVLTIHHSQLTIRAVKGNWTLDLFLTKEVLYHWATTAGIAKESNNKFSFIKELIEERETRLELATYSLEGYRSTKWATSAKGNCWFCDFDILRFENNITKSLHLKISNSYKELWVEKDSNLRTRERTDLQSVAFSHSAICPFFIIDNWKQSIAIKPSHLSESNQRPTDYKSVALPAELKWHI